MSEETKIQIAKNTVAALDYRMIKFVDANNMFCAYLEQHSKRQDLTGKLSLCISSLSLYYRDALAATTKKEFGHKIDLAYEELNKIIGLLGKGEIRKDNTLNPKAVSLVEEAKAFKKVFLPIVIKRRIFDWAESIAVAFILAMVIRAFVVQAFKIPTGSMRTTLLEGDVILVSKFIYGAKVPFTKIKLPALRKPQRGDVVVFVYPVNPKKDFIKRMVGLPGDTIEIKEGTIYVNDKALLEPEFNRHYYYNRGDYAQEGQKIKVPSDSYFVMGDNSASSQDSRYWGFVPADNIIGKALIIYWPPQRIRVIK